MAAAASGLGVDGGLRYPHGRVDFKARAEVVRYNAWLLATRFGVAKWRLTQSALVPALGGRAMYVRFLRQLMLLASRRKPRGGDDATGGDVKGLDIGTGASAVYALLAASMYGWRVVAADSDEDAVACARGNVARNPHIDGLVQVVKVDADAPLLGAVGGAIDFCVCNPPFFDDCAADGGAAALGVPPRGGNPRTARGGRRHEMHTPGGDAAFAARLASESRRRGADVYWYTTLLGHKAAYRALLRNLDTESPKPTVVRTCTIQPGSGRSATTRWVVAWSFAAPPAARTTPLQRVDERGAVVWDADVWARAAADGDGAKKDEEHEHEQVTLPLAKRQKVQE